MQLIKHSESIGDLISFQALNLEGKKLIPIPGSTPGSKIDINMCMYMCIHMTSKNISITEDVYNKLIKIKREDESFSELFLRLLKIQKNTLEKSFGAWDLSEEEEKEIWSGLNTRNGRAWNKSNLEDVK